MPHHRRLPPSGPPNRPLKARTPARPDGANLKPPAPAAGGFTFGAVPARRAGRPRPLAASRWGRASTAGGAPPPAGGFTFGGPRRAAFRPDWRSAGTPP